MTPEEAERYILSRELFGMRFGLDRMRRLMTTLDNPQLRFGSIHVVGTNGKSSTTRMIAAILRRHGLRAGAYLSPHLVSFAERIRVDDEDLTPNEFAAAIQAAQSCDNPVLIRIDTKAGHGGGKPTTKIIEEAADRWAFLVKVLGVEHVKGD